jgi:hypothetical protein
LQASDEDIAKLLDNSDDTLQRWYERFLSEEDSELILAGGESPPPDRIRAIFDRWFERRRTVFRALLCGRLGYGSLSSGTRTTGEIALIATVSSILATSPLPDAVDPLLTATILVGRHKLDQLCDGFET